MDTTWTLSGSPYIVSENVTVMGTDGDDAVTTLTIEPDVKVLFNGNYSITVGASSGEPGALIAEGAPDSPIWFSSNYAKISAGDWQYIMFNTTADSSSLLDYCVLEYGGSSYGAAILYNTSPTIRNTIIRDSKSAGIYAQGSASSIDGNRIVNCAAYGIQLVSENSPDISNCTFSGNGNYDIYGSATVGGTLVGSTFNNGFYIDGGTFDDISGNTFNYNDDYPIHLGADGVGDLMPDNTFPGQDSDSYVEVASDTIENDGVWTDDLKYHILGSITVKGTDGADSVTTLLIESGSEVLFDGNYSLDVGAASGAPGALIAEGTADSPILFSSTGRDPNPGDWQYIIFYTTAESSSLLDYCVLEYGGSSSGAVKLYNASPTIQNTIIRDSKHAGIHAQGSSPSLDGNRIVNCATYGIRFLSASSPHIRNCSFIGNGNYDIYGSSTVGGILTGCTINNGFYIADGASDEISGNTIHYNNDYPVRVGADGVGELVNDNTLSGLDSDSYVEVTTDTVEKDAVWTDDLKYHLLGDISVKGTDGEDSVTTLTIKPGAELLFCGSYNITVGTSSGDPGAMVAEGTSDSTILFSSNHTDPGAGDWQYILFDSTADSSSLLDYCILEYGGASSGMAKFNNASPTIRNTIIRDSKTMGIYAQGSAPSLSGNRIVNCGTHGIYLVSANSPDISNCFFSENGNYDIYGDSTVGGILTGSTLNNGFYIASGNNDEISGNIIYYNNEYPVRIGADSVGELVNDNTFFGLNSDSYVEVTTDTVEKDALWTDILKYHLLGNITVKGTDGADSVTTLLIESGAEVLFDGDYSLAVGAASGAPGALIAEGTADSPILFSSTGAAPAGGGWQDIVFYATAESSSLLDYCVLAYGGSSSAAVRLCNASPTIRNTIIRDSRHAGIHVRGSSPSLAGNRIVNCGTYGIYFLSASSPHISDCSFIGNGNYDIYGSATVGGTLTGSSFNNGFYIASGTNDEISGNTIHYNNDYPIRIGADGVGKLMNDNTFSGLDGDSYVEVTTDTVEKDAVWTDDLKYHLLGNIAVKGMDGDDSVTTLLIEAGTEVLFDGNYSLTVGAPSGDPGKLIAEGTIDSPILFSTTDTDPAAGAWRYVMFYKTAGSSSLMDNCVLEYGGSGNGTVCLYDASPTIRNSTIRYSKNAGVYGTGSGSADSVISCNTFTENRSGITWGTTPPSEAISNNFSGNKKYGIYYSGSSTFIAEDNWWGDVRGPDKRGDGIYGEVDADPWSTEENQCSKTAENSPPNEPNSPDPSDGEVRVHVENGLALSWRGRDPNALDTVTYDLYWGTEADSLALAAQDIAATEYTLNDLGEGRFYFWKIIARDNNGLETAGPVWKFVSDGDSPDLTINSVTIDPVGYLQKGDAVTFTVDVQNIGAGPVVDSFVVDFLSDDISIGTVSFDDVILAGESYQVVQSWACTGIDSSLGIIVDSDDTVNETKEDNNSYSAVLADVTDNEPPVLNSSSPSDGDYVQEIQEISISLSDSSAAVDDTAVIESLVVSGERIGVIDGDISEDGDTFFFSVNNAPLEDGTYSVSFNAADQYGNTQEYIFSFTVDTMHRQNQ
jgi:parallel beta-helix repeat protein